MVKTKKKLPDYVLEGGTDDFASQLYFRIERSFYYVMEKYNRTTYYYFSKEFPFIHKYKITIRDIWLSIENELLNTEINR